MANSKIKIDIKADAKALLDSLGKYKRAVGSTGRAIGKMVQEAREFNESADKLGSAIEKDIRKGAIDNLFAGESTGVQRRGLASHSKRHANNLLDEVDPSVKNNDEKRAMTYMDISFAVTRPKRKTKEPEPSGVEEERCKLGERKLRQEDNSTE